MEYYMRQCSLEHKEVNGVRLQVSWIPEEFARLNKYLKLKEGDIWEDGWKVVNIGARKLASEVHERSQDHKKHRIGSDI